MLECERKGKEFDDEIIAVPSYVVREINFDLLPGEHKVRPYDRPVRGTVVIGRAKVRANLVFARLSMKFSIL